VMSCLAAGVWCCSHLATLGCLLCTPARINFANGLAACRCVEFEDPRTILKRAPTRKTSKPEECHWSFKSSGRHAETPMALFFCSAHHTNHEKGMARHGMLWLSLSWMCVRKFSRCLELKEKLPHQGIPLAIAVARRAPHLHLLLSVNETQYKLCR